jgi:hypothetical protein
LAKFIFQKYFGYETTYAPSSEPVVRKSRYGRANKPGAVSYSKKSKARSIVPSKKKGKSPIIKKSSWKPKGSSEGRLAKKR